MNSKDIKWWDKHIRLEKQLHDDPLIFAWLKNTMSDEEIQALQAAVEKYHKDLIIDVKHRKVERKQPT